MAGNAVFAFICFMLLFWMTSHDDSDEIESDIISRVARNRLNDFHDALHVLNDTRWGDFAPVPEHDGKEEDSDKYLNMTGFRKKDNFSWEHLNLFRKKALDLSHWAFMASDNERNSWDKGTGDPVWRNASGSLRGEWHRDPNAVMRSYDSYNLTEIVPLEWRADNIPWARNITGDVGEIFLRLEGNKTVYEYDPISSQDEHLSAGGTIRNIRGDLVIEDNKGTGHKWDVLVWGNHWPQQGVIIMTTTSEKFNGIFGLPHFTPSVDYFQSSQMLLNKTLPDTLKQKERNFESDQYMPWNSNIENPGHTPNPSPHCELILYAQIHPPSLQDFGLVKLAAKNNPGRDTGAAKILGDSIHTIESELEQLIGVRTPTIPNLQMSAVLYSPDCGYFLETMGPPAYPLGEKHHLIGKKKEILLHQVKVAAATYTTIMFAQLYLLSYELQGIYTPSAMYRLSINTFIMMALMDGGIFTAAAIWASTATTTLSVTLPLVFASFLSVYFLGQVVFKLYELEFSDAHRQTPVPSQPIAQEPSTPAAPNMINRSIQTGSPLPSPATARSLSIQQQPEEPIIIPFDQDIGAEIAQNAAATNPNARTREVQMVSGFQHMLGGYIFADLLIVITVIVSTSFHPFWRSLILNLVAFLSLSFWVPQIYRNIIRDSRRPLSRRFIIGQSIMRLSPTAYFWVNEDNLFFAHTQPRMFLLLCAWVWIQILIMLAQDILGPGYGIPKSWIPQRWDYHPILSEDKLESGNIPLGLIASHMESRDGCAHTDCAICREVLEIPVPRDGDEVARAAAMEVRKAYMVTPCRHIFHSHCLNSWVQIRLQCPICREDLPAL